MSMRLRRPPQPRSVFSLEHPTPKAERVYYYYFYFFLVELLVCMLWCLQVALNTHWKSVPGIHSQKLHEGCVCESEEGGGDGEGLG